MSLCKFRKLKYDSVHEEILKSSDQSSVYIGCDSKLNGPYTIFGLVIIIHIDGHKGGMVFGKKSSITRRMSINERLMAEVDLAMECAFNIYTAVGNRLFEVHLDLNPNPEHQSNRVLKQAVSYVKAQGFNYRIKPGAWAATTAADYLIS